MSFATMTPTQALIIRNARANSGADERKQIKREVFASAKARFGIPQDYKLSVATESHEADYLVLKDRNGNKFELAADGLWVNAVRAAPVAPTPEAKRWFPVDMAEVIAAVTDGEFDDGEQAPPMGTTLTIAGQNCMLDADGDLHIQLGASAFTF